MPEQPVDQLRDPRQGPPLILAPAVRRRASLQLGLQPFCLVIVELTAVERIDPVHEAQLLTYLRISNTWLRLLINFNVPVLKDGILRRVLG